MLRNMAGVVALLATTSASLLGITASANAAPGVETCGYVQASGPLKNHFGKTLATVSVSVHTCYTGKDVTQVNQPITQASVNTTGQIDQWQYDSDQHDATLEHTKRGQEGVVTEQAKFVQLKNASAPLGPFSPKLPVEHTSYVKMTIRIHGNGTFDVTGSSG